MTTETTNPRIFSDGPRKQTIILPNGPIEIEANFRINQPNSQEWSDLSLMDIIRYITDLHRVGVIGVTLAFENIEVAIHG